MRDPADYRVSSVVPDFYECGRSAARYLASKGHKRIAHLAIRNDNFLILQKEEAGYRDALRECGLPFDPSLLIVEPAILLNEIRASLKVPQRIIDTGATAVYVVSDYVAIGLVKALQELNVRIPQDISILSVSNVDHCLVTTPMLTSIDLSSSKSVEKAVGLLMKMQSDPTRISHIRVPFTIIERQSVSTLPGASHVELTEKGPGFPHSARRNMVSD